MFFNTHRSLNGDGIVISIVGIDGSGKSTTVNACHEAISKKIDCVKVYFGNGTSGGLFQSLPICIALSTIFLSGGPIFMELEFFVTLFVLAADTAGK